MNWSLPGHDNLADYKTLNIVSEVKKIGFSHLNYKLL